MKSRLIAAIVVGLVFCIVTIVYSPFVDLPLTTLRTYGAAATLQQILFLAWVCSRARARTASSVIYVDHAPDRKRREIPTRKPHLIDLICAYLC
jgi:hypothetical protein